MKNFLNSETLKSVAEHWPEKLAASAGVATVADAMGVQLQLIAIFIVLAGLDIFTRWLAQSAKLWHDLYPQTPGSVWQYYKNITQARRWRYIKSKELRDRFLSKLGTYITILFAASVCDVAMLIAHAPTAWVVSLITMVLSCTEFLSILENLQECNVQVARELVALVKKRKEAIK